MYPILFQIGNFPIYNYGVTMALGFLIAFGWIFWQAKRLGENMDDYYNICLIALIGGIVGARLMFVIVSWRYFIGNPLSFFNLRAGGLVWYGGIALPAVLIYLYTRRKHMSFRKVSDLVSAPIMIGLAVGRIGCLMSGCCYGKPCDLPWAITYPESTFLPPAISGQRVHPSPIYEMIACLIIAAILAYLQKHKTRDGVVFWSLFLLYGAARFILELWRGDNERGFIIPGYLSVSQVASLVAIAVAIFMILKMRKSNDEDIIKPV